MPPRGTKQQGHGIPTSSNPANPAPPVGRGRPAAREPAAASRSNSTHPSNVPPLPAGQGTLTPEGGSLLVSQLQAINLGHPNVTGRTRSRSRVGQPNTRQTSGIEGEGGAPNPTGTPADAHPMPPVQASSTHVPPVPPVPVPVPTPPPNNPAPSNSLGSGPAAGTRSRKMRVSDIGANDRPTVEADLKAVLSISKKYPEYDFAENLGKEVEEQLEILKEVCKLEKEEEGRHVKAISMSSLNNDDIAKLGVEVAEVSDEKFYRCVLEYFQEGRNKAVCQGMEKWLSDNIDTMTKSFCFIYLHWSMIREAGARSLIDPLLGAVMSMISACNAGYTLMFPELRLADSKHHQCKVVFDEWVTLLTGTVDYFLLNFVIEKVPTGGQGASLVRSSFKKHTQKVLTDSKNLDSLVQTSNAALKKTAKELETAISVNHSVVEAKGKAVNLEDSRPQLIGEAVAVLQTTKRETVSCTLTRWAAWKFGMVTKIPNDTEATQFKGIFVKEMGLDATSASTFPEEAKKIFRILAFFAVATEDDLRQVFHKALNML